MLQRNILTDGNLRFLVQFRFSPTKPTHIRMNPASIHTNFLKADLL